MLTISEKFNDYAAQVLEKLRAAGLRSDTYLRAEKIGNKIRLAQLQKIPYMLVIGEKEQQCGAVAVRHRARGDEGQVSVDAFIERCLTEIKQKQ